MAISDQLEELRTIRADIRTALVDKGITAGSHNFADFASDIALIQGESSWDSAKVIVDAESGSTVYAAKSSGTESKQLEEHVLGTGRSQYVQFIENSDFGSWVYTASKGSYSSTSTVSVSNNICYSVVMSYELYIVKNGVYQNNLNAIALDTKAESSTAGIRQESDSTFMYTTNVALFVTNSMTVDGYKTISITCKSGSSPVGGYIGVWELTNPEYGDSVLTSSYCKKYVYLSLNSSNEYVTTTLDISDITGTGRIGYCGKYPASEAYITEMLVTP